MAARLTPALLAAFEQCPRRLWLAHHRPDLIPAPTAPVFDNGRAVRALARGLHPHGARIDPRSGTDAAIARTRALIESGHPGPLFGATFRHRDVVVRADLLERAGAGVGEGAGEGEGGWTLAALTGAARAKDAAIHELATRFWAITRQGLTLDRVVVRHVDTGFLLETVGDHRGLLVDHDVTAAVRALACRRPQQAAAARATLEADEPACHPGGQCHRPRPCPFLAHCSADLPPAPQWPVTVLPDGGWRKWARKGFVDLLDLDETAMKPREAMIVTATRSGRPHHDAAGARRAMAGWSYPRAWIDFETIAAAVPRWPGTRPYQQVPFQFSLHLEQAAEERADGERAGGAITHHEYLCCDGSDPRPGCAAALVAAIPADATLVAYNAGFERAVLRALAAQVPAHADALSAMAERVVDLHPVARAHWYHRDQRGSWSIKAVLPTLAALDYAALEVKDGGMAQDSFLEAIDPATSTDRRHALEQALRAYCERDTWAMVLIARRLADAAAE